MSKEVGNKCFSIRNVVFFPTAVNAGGALKDSNKKNITKLPIITREKMVCFQYHLGSERVTIYGVDLSLIIFNYSSITTMYTIFENMICMHC